MDFNPIMDMSEISMDTQYIQHVENLVSTVKGDIQKITEANFYIRKCIEVLSNDVVISSGIEQGKHVLFTDIRVPSTLIDSKCIHVNNVYNKHACLLDVCKYNLIQLYNFNMDSNLSEQGLRILDKHEIIRKSGPILQELDRILPNLDSDINAFSRRNPPFQNTYTEVLTSLRYNNFLEERPVRMIPGRIAMMTQGTN